MGEGSGTPSIYLLQKSLVEAGYEVHFIVPVGERSKVKTLESVTFHYFSIPLASLRPKNILIRRLLTKVYWLFFVFFGWLKARAVADEIKPDVIYGHTSYGAPIAYLIAKKLKTPNVTRLYGTFLYPHLPSFWQRLKKIEEVIAFKTPSALIIITDDGTRGDEVAKYFKLPASRMKFWMNGVDKSKFDPNFDVAEFKRQLGIASDARIILAVSRLERWKGVDRLIKSVPEVVAARNDLVFLVIGDGSERESLHKMAHALQINSFVRFIGAIPSSEVTKFMNAADIFVSLQDYSNLGNPLFEAMVCGKCILTLDTGDTARIIRSGETGILLSLKNLEELPEKIIHLLDNNELRNELGKNARQYALDNFQSWDQRIEMEIAELEELEPRARGEEINQNK